MFAETAHASVQFAHVVDAAAFDDKRAAGVHTDAELCGYICGGPLLTSCGITPADVQKELTAWKGLGLRLATQLGLDAQNLKPHERQRIFQYYLPVYFWVDSHLRQHQKAQPEGTPVKPLVVGISAPQGCGKSTLVEQLQELFTWLGRSTASVSIDDFYLTYEGQGAVAAANPGNPLLQYRGNAGTHDLELGTRTLEALKGLVKEGDKVAVPRYNKSAYAGRGDRADPSTWPEVKGPLELVLFEGWMLGFAPQEGLDAAAASVDANIQEAGGQLDKEEEVAVAVDANQVEADKQLEEKEVAPAVDANVVEVNRQLLKYKEAWDSHVDTWLVIRVGDPKWVFKWRLQAEEKMISSGKAGMTTGQVEDFVARFMPAYQAYLPSLYSKGPTTARAGNTLVVQVDENRCPVTPKPQPITPIEHKTAV